MQTRVQVHGSEFDDFLFAPIGEDSNGLLLSVVSMLARQNLDPWAEAAGFAGLPAMTAARKLAALIRALPAVALRQPDALTTATHLIALLPHRPEKNDGAPSAPVGSRPAHLQRLLLAAIAFAIYLASVLSMHFILK